MCGRFTLDDPSATLAKILDTLNRPFIVPFFPRYTPKFNIAPTQYVPVIRQQDVVLMRWGLVPSWSKSLTGPPLFNACAETVAEKPSFRTAFKRRRCIVPASGFYEWEVIGPKEKRPHYISLTSGEPMAFAGLWETWNSPNGPLESCTIITTAANEFMAKLHDRMPVILEPEEFAPWLDPDVDPSPMLNLYSGEMTEHPVSSAVGNVRNDSPDLIKPI